MKAVIPAAGIGKRLRPLTNNIPKVLIDVAGKPMVSYIIDELLKIEEIDSIILIVGYLGDKVKEYISKTYPVSLNKFQFAEQTEMLGLGHAVYQAKDLIGNEPVIIVLGDTIFEFNMKEFLSSEFSNIGVKDVEDITRFGIVESKNGFITRMIEKPAGEHITKSKSAIAGVYFIKNSDRLFSSLSNNIENNIRTKDEFQLTDALQLMISEGEKFTTFHITNWFDCGKPETLKSTSEYILKKQKQ